MLVYYNLDLQDLVVFSDDDLGSIGRPCPNISFRTRVACCKSSKIKLLAQFPFKRHGNELCSDFDGKSGLGFLVVFSSDGDSGSIERPFLNLFFRTRVACSKSFEIKLLAQFPFKRHGKEVWSS